MIDSEMTAAMAAFAAQGPLHALPGERTRNARVVVAGTEVVLKVHAAGDRDDIELETAALQWLQANPQVRDLVPAPVPSPGGELIVEVDAAGPRLARALSWTPGGPWPSGAPGSSRLRELGALVARVDAALIGLAHPHAGRPLRWNLATASSGLDLVDLVADPELAAQVAQLLRHSREVVEPALDQLPAQLIHNDANEANLVIGYGDRLHLIDFGDVCTAPRICGPAVAATYQLAAAAAAGRDLWTTLRPMLLGYHQQVPLSPSELALLPDLVRSRAALSVVMAAWQHSLDPANEYLLVSQAAVRELLRQLPATGDHLLLCRLREALGYEPDPTSRAVRAFLATADPAPVLAEPWLSGPRRTLDWSHGEVGHENGSAATAVAAAAAPTTELLIGRYREDRPVYTSAAFAPVAAGGLRRTVHLGVDLFAPAGTVVQAALDGVVHAFGDNDAPLDYGPVIVLEHQLPDCAIRFYSLYGHLGRASLADLVTGQRCEPVRRSPPSVRSTRMVAGSHICICNC